jgi:hypothetical protein
MKSLYSTVWYYTVLHNMSSTLQIIIAWHDREFCSTYNILTPIVCNNMVGVFFLFKFTEDEFMTRQKRYIWSYKVSI